MPRIIPAKSRAPVILDMYAAPLECSSRS